VILPCQFDQRLAVFRFYIRCVDHRQPARRQPLRRHEVQHVEGIIRGCKAIFIVGNQRPAVVRRNHFRGKKVFPRKRTLAGPGCPDEHN